MICVSRRDWLRVGAWAALSFGFNLVWEIAQLPLYTIAASGSLYELATAVVHCSIGDLFISTGAFILGMFALGDSQWPSTHPWKGSAIAIGFGFAYTAYSEWYNVFQAGNWTYTPAMPRVFGLGISPLLQWLVVPAVAVWAWNRFEARDPVNPLQV